MLETVKELDKSIEKITIEIKTLEEEKNTLEKTKEVLFKVNDICPSCLGKGHTCRESSGGDPYERTSDLMENCPRCKGEGKYKSE